jgi:dGTPase
MDLADDIAYSVHDLEDFLRAGLIPLERLRDHPEYLDLFIDEWASWAKAEGEERLHDLIGRHRGVASEWLAITFAQIRGDATFQERAALKEQTSGTIGKFVSDATLREPDAEGRSIYVSPENRFLMKFCQRLVWVFVISNPRLATIQYGQGEAIKSLLEIYRSAVVDACAKKGHDLIPPRFLIGLDHLDAKDDDGITRLAVDIVASLTDDQAIVLHRRFAGIERRGSVTDILYS